MVLYAIGQGVICTVEIVLIGVLISGIKGTYGEDNRETVRKVVKWASIILHVAQAAFAALWVIDALFPLLDEAITAIEQGIIAFIDRHMIILVVVGLFIWFFFIRNHNEKPPMANQLEKPSERDYFRALDTLRPAAMEIAGALGFAPIDNFTDMAPPRPVDRIKPWGRSWLMVYKIPKANANAEADQTMIKRVLEDQMDTVVQRENPSGYAELCFPWQGVDKPILLVHDVLDRDAYIYVYIVKASRAYLEDKANANDRKDREDGSSQETLYED